MCILTFSARASPLYHNSKKKLVSEPLKWDLPTLTSFESLRSPIDPTHLGLPDCSFPFFQFIHKREEYAIEVFSQKQWKSKVSWIFSSYLESYSSSFPFLIAGSSGNYTISLNHRWPCARLYPEHLCLLCSSDPFPTFPTLFDLSVHLLWNSSPFSTTSLSILVKVSVLPLSSFSQLKDNCPILVWTLKPQSSVILAFWKSSLKIQTLHHLLMAHISMS